MFHSLTILSKINNTNKTASEISDLLKANVGDTDYLFGGDVIIITGLLHKLAEKHITDMPTNTEACNRNFTSNILEVADVFLNASIAWNEINEDHVRHKCSSQLLSAIDHISYLYIISLPSNDRIHSFKYNHLQILLKYVPKKVDERILHNSSFHFFTKDIHLSPKFTLGHNFKCKLCFNR